MAITNINFTLNAESGRYEATFTAQQDFILHLEAEKNASFTLSMKHPSANNYSEAEYLHNNPFDGEISCGTSDSAYPRSILLSSSMPVTQAFYE